LREIRPSKLQRFIHHLRRGPERLGWRAMPGLMRTGTVVSALFVVMWLCFIPLAALNVGDYSIDERVVTGRYFLAHIYPVLLPFLALCAVLAYGYWTERVWARPLPVIFWLAVDGVLFWQIVMGEVVGGDAIEIIIWAILYVVVALWYCFYKSSVAAYYRALERAYGRGMVASEVDGASRSSGTAIDQ